MSKLKVKEKYAMAVFVLYYAQLPMIKKTLKVLKGFQVTKFDFQRAIDNLLDIIKTEYKALIGTNEDNKLAPDVEEQMIQLQNGINLFINASEKPDFPVLIISNKVSIAL